MRGSRRRCAIPTKGSLWASSTICMGGNESNAFTVALLDKPAVSPGDLESGMDAGGLHLLTSATS